MLKLIRCSLFRNKEIAFKEGLNVVIGDDNASNSIGKSTLLMLIDFAFGGTDFLIKNRDVVDELGHHEYEFSFSFKNTDYYFARKTDLHDIIYVCDADYNYIDELPLDKYHKLLSDLYNIPNSISFRAMVSLYSRVWLKENLDVKKPLHTVPVQNVTECIDNLIKTFDLFNQLDELSLKLKVLNSEKAAFNAAFSKKIITKINKTQYKKNLELISQAETEITYIKENLTKLAVDWKELVNKEVLETKLRKDRLLDYKLNLENKLARVRSNLVKNKFTNSKAFSGLTDYFPNINVEKLEIVESFHMSIANILKQELKASESNLLSQLDEINGELHRLEEIISSTLKTIENPNIVVDKVFELSNSLSKARSENSYYDAKLDLVNKSIEIAYELNERKINILDEIMLRINTRLILLTKEVYGQNGKSPTLILKESSYEFTIFEDTGTGKAYSSLILFDLAILLETKLPFLIHDSVLYKNVENDAVANLIKIYSSIKKQSFIAIDEISKYGNAKTTLIANKVIQLTSNTVLYNRSWKVKK